jgi:hypothetical protein
VKGSCPRFRKVSVLSSPLSGKDFKNGPAHLSPTRVRNETRAAGPSSLARCGDSLDEIAVSLTPPNSKPAFSQCFVTRRLPPDARCCSNNRRRQGPCQGLAVADPCFRDAQPFDLLVASPQLANSERSKRGVLHAPAFSSPHGRRCRSDFSTYHFPDDSRKEEQKLSQSEKDRTSFSRQ